MKSALRSLLAPLLILGASSASAAVYQWSIPQEAGRRAYLWIPEKCPRIRGLVLDMNNLTESALIEHTAVRSACAAENVGILWLAEGSWAPSALANRWGDSGGLTSQEKPIYQRYEELEKKGFPAAESDSPKARQCLPLMRAELARRAGETLDRLLAGLAEESGYSELRHAPLLVLGHSMTGILPWEMSYTLRERLWGAIPVKTGMRESPPAGFANASAQGVPLLYINQYDPDGNATRSVVARQDTNRLFGRIFDWGGSHFEMSDPMAEIVALFIRKAAQYRLSAEIPADGFPKLRELTPESGYLVTSLEAGPNPQIAPESQYKGSKNEAFWYFDQEMAQRAVEHERAHRTRLRQFVTVVSNGQTLQPGTGPFGSVKIPFESGIEDGFTFKLTGAFLDASQSQPAGHASSGEVVVKSAGGGSLAELAPGLFRFRPGPMGFNGKALNCWLVASHPGDAQYARTHQPAFLGMPERISTGKTQEITFPPLANVTSATREVELRAKASSGLPVEYFVVSGPAEISGSKLRFTAIPPGARYPVKVIVTAYQMGHVKAPQVRSAAPIPQMFLIGRDESDLTQTARDVPFFPAETRHVID